MKYKVWIQLKTCNQTNLLLSNVKLQHCFLRSVRALCQMLEHLQLEAVFAWLSTLGGAHSALGDYFNRNVIDTLLTPIRTWLNLIATVVPSSIGQKDNKT